MASLQIERPLQHHFYDTIKDGIMKAYTACCGIRESFLELSCIMTAKYLEEKQIKEIFDLLLETYSIDKMNQDQADYWFASRKSLIVASSHLFLENKLANGIEDFDGYFKQAMKPLVPEEIFSEKNEPYLLVLNQMEKITTSFKVKIFELFKFYIILRVSLVGRSLGGSWKDTHYKWQTYFYETSEPVFILGYLQLVKEMGRVDQLVDAYNKFIRQLEESNKLTDNKVARTYLQILYDLHEIMLLHTTHKKHSSHLEELQNRISKVEPNLPALKKTFLLELLITDLNNQVSSADSGFPLSLTLSTTSHLGHRLNSLNVNDVETGPLDTEVNVEEKVLKFIKRIPVFLHNLPFKATEKDIKHGFSLLGVNLIEVDLTTKNGKKTGCAVAYVEFESQKEKIVQLKTTRILDRDVHIEDYKPVVKEPRPPKPQATLLVVPDVPEEFQDLEMIKNEFSRYGHVKNVCFVEKDPNTIKIEFYMESDCMNAYHQWREGKVLPDLKGIRKGYPAGTKDKKRKYQAMSVNKNDGTTRNNIANGSEPPPKKLDLSNKKAESKGNKGLLNFVPSNVRNRMRNKMSIPTTSAGNPMEVEDEEVNATPVEKQKGMSNEEFRKFLLNK